MGEGLKRARAAARATRTKPKNIQWIVSGRATYSGATCVVHAVDRAEALKKANAGDYIGSIDIEGAEMVDWEFRIAEYDCDDSE